MSLAKVVMSIRESICMAWPGGLEKGYSNMQSRRKDQINTTIHSRATSGTIQIIGVENSLAEVAVAFLGCHIAVRMNVGSGRSANAWGIAQPMTVRANLVLVASNVLLVPFHRLLMRREMLVHQ